MLKSMNIEQIAKTCHEANRIYCEQIGDYSQPLWDDAPEWMKVSARKGVKYIMENPTLSAADLHESWLKHKQDEGWQYGETKNPAKKLHPCMIPYKELTREQRFKDNLFLTIVKSFL